MKKELRKRSKNNSNYYNTHSIYRKDIAAFDIDSKVKDGRLALMYRGNFNKP
jgi:hypothetical protein